MVKFNNSNSLYYNSRPDFIRYIISKKFVSDIFIQRIIGVYKMSILGKIIWQYFFISSRLIPWNVLKFENLDFEKEP